MVDVEYFEVVSACYEILNNQFWLHKQNTLSRGEQLWVLELMIEVAICLYFICTRL
jgi:hypothetical protein